MGLRLKNSSGNYVELNAPSSIATDFGLTLPVNDGDSGQYLQTNGSGTLSWAGVSGLPAQVLTLGTAVASTSGTSIDFTSIPSGVKRITLNFKGVSKTGTSHLLVRPGTSSGFATTGYGSTSLITAHGVANAGIGSTAGFVVFHDNANFVKEGSFVLTNLSGNNWVGNHVVGHSDTTYTGLVTWGGGSLALGATLDRIRLTTVNGSDTFNGGTVNILYEG